MFHWYIIVARSS